MRRREFIKLAATLTAWPLAARAQTAVPVIGFVRNASPASSAALVDAFRRGLQESALVEGHNLAVEYRWAESGDDELPELLADLVRRQVKVIATGGGAEVALAAKRATATIPIVFELGGDPVKLGLVESFNRPGGNITGIALFSNLTGPKRIELLQGLASPDRPFAILVHPGNPNSAREVDQARDATAALGRRLVVLSASAPADFDAAFKSLAAAKCGALAVTANPMFVAARARLVALAAQYAVPAIYPFRDFAEAGGLISYGDNLADAFRQLGVYCARVVQGASPADLPVIRSTKFELVVNRRTARALGLNVPPFLLALADEVIE